MTATTHPAAPSVSTSAATALSPRAWTWRRTTRVAAITTIVATVVLMTLGRFVGPSLIVLDIVLLAGLWRMRGGGRRGLLLIAAINLANLLLHAPMNAALVRTVESPYSFVIGVVGVLASVGALIGAVAAWRTPVAAASRAARGLVVAGVAVTAAAIVVGSIAYATRTSDAAAPGDALIVTTGAQVTPQELEVTTGSITVHVTNTDALSPRAFDINEVDVHLVVPPRTARRITFTAPPGTYDFYDQFTFTPATSGELIVR